MVTTKAMLKQIPTEIQYNHHRVYRLIDRNLYSTETKKSLDQQAYILEKKNVIPENQSNMLWRIEIRDGEIYLETWKPHKLGKKRYLSRCKWDWLV